MYYEGILVRALSVWYEDAFDNGWVELLWVLRLLLFFLLLIGELEGVNAWINEGDRKPLCTDWAALRSWCLAAIFVSLFKFLVFFVFSEEATTSGHYWKNYPTYPADSGFLCLSVRVEFNINTFDWLGVFSTVYLLLGSYSLAWDLFISLSLKQELLALLFSDSKNV